MIDKIKSVIAEQLGVDEASITAETRLIEDLNADSLDLAAMVLDLEEQYDIEIPDEDLEKLTTIGTIAEYIESHKK
jgi:acyl carrier protein